MERSRRSSNAGAAHQALIFLHIPKTAGTTFNGVLRDVYGAGFLRIGPQKWQKTRRLPKGVRVATGHMPYGVHKRWGVEPTYITFLRDPVERMISLWWYIKKRTKHPRHKSARKYTVAEFARSRAFAELDNGMVRWLCGAMPTGIAKTGKRVTEEDFETALAHCATMLVGTTETFKADVRRFSRRLGWGALPQYERRMVGKKRPPSSAFTKAERDTIRHVNQWDCQLYEMMKGAQ